MGTTINLIYLSKSSEVGVGFFGGIKKIREEIHTDKTNGGIFNTFTRSDFNEVSRSTSYAVFPALTELVQKGGSISIESIKAELKKAGVTDGVFQHKLLSIVLQSKYGLQFPLVANFQQLLRDQGYAFSADPARNIEFKVKDKNHVQLIYAGTLNDINITPQANALKFSFKIDITPSKVTLNSFKIMQVLDSEQANSAFSFLQENQVSLWQKFKLWVMSFFTGNEDLEFENAATDKIQWREESDAGANKDIDVVSEDDALNISGMSI